MSDQQVGRDQARADAASDGRQWPPGWSRPRPDYAPRPTYWPAVLAIGITAVFFGVVTSPLIAIVGLVLCIVALAGWIGALINDHQ